MADTIAGNTTTTANLPVNSWASSNIDFTGDSDWWRISLTAGQTYVFDAVGWYAGVGTLVDPILGLVNPSATAYLAVDDDSGFYSLSSRIVFTPSTTSAYYLDVQESGSNAVGSYVIVAATDIGDSPSTAANLSTGVPISSSIQYLNDFDAFRFNVATPSVVTVNFDAPTGSPAYAFAIEVFTGGLSPLTYWSPVGDYSFAFGAPVAGDYYIQISKGSSYSEATYAVSVTSQSTNFGTIPATGILPLSGDHVIDATTHGFYWNLDSTRTITWAIADTGLGVWIDPHTALIRGTEIFSEFEAVANIHFKNLGYYSSFEAGQLSGADIVVSLDAENVIFASNSTWARSFFPSTQSEVGYYAGAAGDVWINANSAANNLDYTEGSSGYFLMLHELGHSLGLKHPHDDGGTGRPTFSQSGIGSLDMDWASVMSYNDDFDWNLREWEPSTAMALDILALQALYGVNPNTNSGNSTHELFWNGTYQSIWDASGADVVSAGSSVYSWTIVLPTSLNDFGITSSIPTKVGYAVVTEDLSLSSPTSLYWLIGDLENSVGSNQDDYIVGNSLSNVISGNAGNDFIVGGRGNDTLDGGSGVDAVSYTDFLTGVTVRLGSFAIGVDSGVDQVIGVENILGGGSNDILSGDGSDNILSGGGGADIIAGGPGNDIYGVDNGGDQVMELANSGNDFIGSSVSYDLMQAWHVENLELTDLNAINGSGNWLDNFITGNIAANILSGNRGNDTLDGGGGNDTLSGGDGNDVLVWDAADGSIQGGAGNDTLFIDGSGLTLNLAATPDSLIQDIEVINIMGAGGNTLTLNLPDVLAISSTTDLLRIDGNAGVVNRGGGWTTGGDQVIGLNSYHTYTQGIATLLVDTDITVNV
jgi:serralysin